MNNALCSLHATLTLLLASTTLYAEATLTIVADSSLKPVLAELTQAWADQQPDTNVELQFTNAETIQQQLVDNKAGDVVILADPGDVQEAGRRGFINVAEQKQVAHNELIIYGRKALLPDEQLEWFDLIAREWETLSLGDPARTASGRAARNALKTHKLAVRLNAESTRLCGNEVAALDCARRGEVEAAFLLRSDLGATKLEGFVIYPIDRADYPGLYYVAAPTKSTKSLPAARSYIAALAAKHALPIWAKYGYNQPNAPTGTPQTAQ